MSGNEWYRPPFDDSAWTAVSLPVGGSIPAQEDRYFRGAVTIDGHANATISFDSDDGIWVFVNGVYEGHWGGDCHSGGCVGHPPTSCGSSPVHVDISNALVVGPNVIAFHVRNAGGGSYANLYFTSFAIISPPLDLLRPPADGFCSPTCLFDWVAAAGQVSKYVLYTDGTVRKDNIPPPLTQYALTVSEQLSDGPHSWTVQGCDGSGCTQSPNTFTVNIDGTPPAPFGLTDPPDGSWQSRGNTFYFQWATTSDGASATPSGLDRYQVAIDGHLAAAAPSDATAIASFGAGIPNALTDGDHVWQVTALDQVGNATTTAARTVRIDSTPPTFPVFSPDPPDRSWTTNRTPTVHWQVATDTGSGVARQYVQLDSAMPYEVALDSTSFTFPAPLAEGTHVWSMLAVDQAGNAGDSRAWVFGVDTTAPTSLRLDGTNGTPDGAVVSSLTPTLCWTRATDAGVGLAEYRLYLNDVLTRAGISPTSTCTTPTQGLTDGAYQWHIDALDFLGNTAHSLETFSFTVDTQPPEAFQLIAPTDGATLAQARPMFSWTASIDRGSGLDRYELSLDNGAGGVCPSPCVIPGAQTSFVPSSDLGVGQHTWFATAVDKSGKKTQAGPQSFGVVATPTATSTPTDTATLTANSTATVTRTSTATGTRTTTATGTATATASVTATPTLTNTRTITPTETMRATATTSATPTSTFIASATRTSTPTVTDTNTPTVTDTPSATGTATLTATATGTATASETQTVTAIPTAPPTASTTRTNTATASVTVTPLNTATPTVTPTPSPAATDIPTPSPLPTATVASAFCAGDCDGNGQVTIDELVLMVNIGLGNSPLSRCGSADLNGDGTVTIDELVRAVGAALQGCGG